MVCVENTRPSTLKLRFGVTLAPGVNAVDRFAWGRCKSDPITKHYLSHRFIRVVSGPEKTETPKAAGARPKPEVGPEPRTPGAGPAPLSKAEPLEKGHVGIDPAGMLAKEVIEYVKACDDSQELLDMLPEVARVTVREAVEARLRELGGD